MLFKLITYNMVAVKLRAINAVPELPASLAQLGLLFLEAADEPLLVLGAAAPLLARVVALLRQPGLQGSALALEGAQLLRLVLSIPLQPPDAALAVADTLDDALLVPSLALLGRIDLFLEGSQLLLLAALDLCLRILGLALQLLLEGPQLVLVVCVDAVFLLCILIRVTTLSEVQPDLLLALVRVELHPLLDRLDLVLQAIELLLPLLFETLPHLFFDRVLPAAEVLDGLFPLPDDVPSLALDALVVLVLHLLLLLVEPVVDLRLIVGELADGLRVEAELLFVELRREEVLLVQRQVAFDVRRLHDEVLVLLLDLVLLALQICRQLPFESLLLAVVLLLGLVLEVGHLHPVQLALALLLALQSGLGVLDPLLGLLLKLGLDLALPLADILLDLQLAFGLQPLPEAVEVPVGIAAHLHLQVDRVLLDIADLFVPLHLRLPALVDELLLQLLKVQAHQLVDSRGSHRAGHVQLILEERHRLREWVTRLCDGRHAADADLAQLDLLLHLLELDLLGLFLRLLLGLDLLLDDFLFVPLAAASLLFEVELPVVIVARVLLLQFLVLEVVVVHRAARRLAGPPASRQRRLEAFLRDIEEI